MQKVILTIGLPASGKTTWAKKELEENPSKYKRINKDDLRAMLDGKWSPASEKFILQSRDTLIEQALRDGFSVIVDDTNLHPSHIRNISLLVDRFNLDTSKDVKVETKFFNTSVSDCIVRDKQRPNGVGEKVIYNMYNQFSNIHNFDDINPIEQDVTLTKAIIVDIDGTVAHRIDRGPFEWSRVKEDLPKREILDIVKMFHDNGYGIIFLSGRDEVCYDLTLEWIKDHFCETYKIDHNGIQLYMRPKDDVRKDSIVKKELFMEHVYNKYYITHVLDDRNQTVAGWRAMGLTCLQVAQGNF